MSKPTTAQHCLFKYTVYLDSYLLAGLGLHSLCKDSSLLIWVIFGMESTRGTSADYFFPRRREISHYRWSCWNATEEGRWKRAVEHEACKLSGNRCQTGTCALHRSSATSFLETPCAAKNVNCCLILLLHWDVTYFLQGCGESQHNAERERLEALAGWSVWTMTFSADQNKADLL